MKIDDQKDLDSQNVEPDSSTAKQLAIQSTESTQSLEDQVTFKPSKRNWKSFWALMVMQTQNNFNDKAVQFLLVCASSYLLVTGYDNALTNGMAHVLAGLIVTPFILLAPFAGWISDRFSKTKIIQLSSFFQLLVFALLVVAVLLESLGLCIICFFFLAIQSAILGPAKVGVVKELVGRKKLAFASGLMEMLTILGILGGTIVMSRWYASLQSSGLPPWEALKMPVYVLIALTPLAILASFMMEKTESKGKRPFKMKILFEHFGQLKSVLKRRELRLSGIAVSYFWSFAGFVQLLSVQIANEASSSASIGIGADLANMMLMAGGGIALGSVLGSYICKNRIELGLVPIGGVVMVAMCFLMATSEVLSFWFMFGMFVAGLGGALFLVPVHAYIQDVCKESERGNVLAVSNLMNCFGGILAVILQLVFMQVFHFSPSTQFAILAGVTLLATIYSARLLPVDTVRLLALSVIRMLYKIRVQGSEKIPSEGGVLLVPNHLTYVDAFIISASCNRIVRFLIFEELYENKKISWFLKLFKAVPISSKNSKDAIKVAVETLREGEVVCIFPEGQLSRTGTLNEIKRGYEIIAKKANVPVQPVYMDGLWGSIFSFERRKYFHKMPYRIQYGVNVAFADVMPPRDASNTKLRSELQKLCYQAMSQRSIMQKPELLVSKLKKIKYQASDSEVIEQAQNSYANLSEEERKEAVFNTLQLLEGPAVAKGQSLAIEVEAVTVAEASVTFLYLLPLLAGSKIRLVEIDSDSHKLEEIIAKDRPEIWIASPAFFDKHTQLKGEKYSINGELKEDIYPWFIEEGKVISIQMREPTTDSKTAGFQAGFIEHSRGRVLAGYQVKGNDIFLGKRKVKTLPEEYKFDEVDFITPVK